MIIDGHNHVWPDHIAGRALGGNVPDMAFFGDGTVADLARAQERAGINYSVCLSVANTPQQVASVNAFAGGLDRARFIPFGTVHPGLSLEENLASLRANDIVGVKIHAVFQGFRLDDRGLLEILEALAGTYPVIIHVGAGGGSDGSVCTPLMLRQIVQALPSLAVIGCHWGGYHRIDSAMKEVIGLPVLIDTSWPPSVSELEPAIVRRLIRSHGAERVVFASDWPTADPEREIDAIRSIGCTDEETSAILGGNLARVLGLEG